MQNTFVTEDGLMLPAELVSRAGFRKGDAITATIENDGTIVLNRNIDGARPRVDADRTPIPPTWMREAVVGNTDPDAFVASGDDAARGFVDVLTNAGFDTATFRSILDFGCGCGRIARAMTRVMRAQILGCDVKPEFVEWCASNLTPARFVVSPEYPPLPFDDHQFDLVYALSIVTHWDEHHQDRWLDEWQRLTRPGGAVIVTFKGSTGPAYGEALPTEWTTRVNENRGVLFVENNYWKGVFPDFYQTAYHATEYVREHWGRYFEILKILPVGTAGIPQDMALMRRR